LPIVRYRHALGILRSGSAACQSAVYVKRAAQVGVNYGDNVVPLPGSGLPPVETQSAPACLKQGESGRRNFNPMPALRLSVPLKPMAIWFLVIEAGFITG